MRFRVDSDKRIQDLRKRRPELKIYKLNENEWEICLGNHDCKKEIEKNLGSSEMENKAIQAKEQQSPIAQNEQQTPVIDPIARPISDISSAFNSLSQIVLMQAKLEIEALRQEINTGKQESREILVRQASRLQEICIQLTNQIDSSFGQANSQILELTTRIDELKRDKEEMAKRIEGFKIENEAFQQKQKEKFVKMSDFLRE